MKKWITAFALSGVFSCNDPESVPHNISTVDSNVALPPDPNLPMLHIDSHRVDTSFPIALDSMSTTILPSDTNYTND